MPRKFLRSLRRRRRSRRRSSKKERSDRRSSKKETTNRRPKSKKMRGGVTTLKAQHLTRLPEDVFGEILEMHPLFRRIQKYAVVEVFFQALRAGIHSQ